MRDLLVNSRTAQIHQIPAVFYEYGIELPRGLHWGLKALPTAFARAEGQIARMVLEALRTQLELVYDLTHRIEVLEQQLAAYERSDERCRRLRAIPGRTLKCLAIVDDATHEAVALVPEHTIGGDHLTRILDGICSQRGKPAMIRSDNGAEFTGRSMLTRAHRSGIALRRIEPGKPNQNAYVESFNVSVHPEASCLIASAGMRWSAADYRQTASSKAWA